VKEVKKYILSKQELNGCIILNFSLTRGGSKFSKEEFISHTEKGIVDYLVKMLKLDPHYGLLLEFSSLMCVSFSELGMKDEMNLILNEIIESLLVEVDYEEKNLSIFLISLTQISKSNLGVDVDFKNLLDFIFTNHVHYLYHYASILVNYQRYDQELINNLMEKLFVIIPTNINQNSEMVDPDSFLAEIVRLLKYDFKPWLKDTFKLCISYPNFFVPYKMFNVLNSLVEIFGEECEIYISKYNVVPLAIQTIRSNV
jgi:hypothetical protein